MLITSRSVEGSTNITALSAGKSFHDGFLKGNKVSAKSKKIVYIISGNYCYYFVSGNYCYYFVSALICFTFGKKITQ